MNKIKKIVIEEIHNVLRENKHKKNINKLTGDLFEAVKTAEAVKSNPKKYKVAKKLITITENRLLKEFHEEGEDKMVKAQLLSIMENAKKLYHMMEDNQQLEDWIQSKITIAEDYLRATYGYMKYYNGVEDMETEVDDEMEWDEVEEEDFDEMDNGIEYEDYDEEEFDSDEIWDDEDEFTEDEDDSDFMNQGYPTV